MTLEESTQPRPLGTVAGNDAPKACALVVKPLHGGRKNPRLFLRAETCGIQDQGLVVADTHFTSDAITIAGTLAFRLDPPARVADAETFRLRAFCHHPLLEMAGPHD